MSITFVPHTPVPHDELTEVRLRNDLHGFIYKDHGTNKYLFYKISNYQSGPQLVAEEMDAIKEAVIHHFS